MRFSHSIPLSLVIPTLNEAENIGILFERLGVAMGGVPFEVLICDDDSKDGTADVAQRLANHAPFEVRVLRRTSQPGLAASILEGFTLARGRVLGVMDADLQHDESILPKMLDLAQTKDVVIGSRYEFMGEVKGWSKKRELESRLAAALTRQMLHTPIRDPLSGFFMVRRSLYEFLAHDLRPQGWKVLLEILGHAPYASYSEVPFTFRSRALGKTKMTWRVARDWIAQLKRLRSLRPVAGLRPTPAVPLLGIAPEGRPL